MTPRTLDVGSVGGKLRAMRRLLDEVVRFGPVDADRFAADYGVQLIVERIVSQLVDLAASVNAHLAAVLSGSAPRDVRSSFAVAAGVGVITADLAAELAPSAGLRDVLVHAYLEVDLEVLAASVPLERERYGEYVRQVAGWLADHPG